METEEEGQGEAGSDGEKDLQEEGRVLTAEGPSEGGLSSPAQREARRHVHSQGSAASAQQKEGGGSVEAALRLEPLYRLSSVVSCRALAFRCSRLFLALFPPYAGEAACEAGASIDCREQAMHPVLKVQWPVLRGPNPSGADSDDEAFGRATLARTAIEAFLPGARGRPCGRGAHASQLPFTARELKLRRRIFEASSEGAGLPERQSAT